MNTKSFFTALVALLISFAPIETAWADKSENIAQSYVVAICRDANSVEILDADSLQSLGRIKVGEAPHEAVQSADGKVVYVANYGTKETPGNSISVIDLAARKEIKRIDLGELKRPHGMVERNGKIYFTAEASKMIARYDPQSDRVDWTAKTDQLVSHMLDASADGKNIYTANMLSSSVTAIETMGSGETKVTQISVGKEPEGISLSPDGKTLWIGHRRDGLISVIETTNQKVIHTLTAGMMPLRLSFTPDGKRVFAINPQEGAVMVFEAATYKETGRISFDGAPVGIAFSPDGNRLFVTDLKNSKVRAFDARNFTQLGETTVETLSDGIAFADKR